MQSGSSSNFDPVVHLDDHSLMIADVSDVTDRVGGEADFDLITDACSGIFQNLLGLPDLERIERHQSPASAVSPLAIVMSSCSSKPTIAER